MRIAYAFFAEDTELGARSFLKNLYGALKNNDEVWMLGQHILTNPHFRAALQTGKAGGKLRQAIEEDRLRPAMMDGKWMNEGINHFSFNKFHRWFVEFDLYDFWSPKLSESYKVLPREGILAYRPEEVSKDIVLMNEWNVQWALDFLDDKSSKVEIQAKNRDHRFKNLFLANLDNAALKKALGDDHIVFKEKALEVYERVENSFGIIRVLPYKRAEEDNISRAVRDELTCQAMGIRRHMDRKKRLNIVEARLDVINNFASALFSRVIEGLVVERAQRDDADVTLIYSKNQEKMWSPFISFSHENRAVRPEKGRAPIIAVTYAR